MINQFKKLFYKVPKYWLFLPCEDIVLSKNWKVCAIREDCGCLEIYDKADYLDKSITYSSSEQYTLFYLKLTMPFLDNLLQS